MTYCDYFLVTIQFNAHLLQVFDQPLHQHVGIHMRVAAVKHGSQYIHLDTRLHRAGFFCRHELRIKAEVGRFLYQVTFVFCNLFGFK